MLFVKVDDLKVGMRLAKPIYNKNGVMLYERNTNLTPQGIVSIKNFGLIGIYILEPAEPLPPLSEEDKAFERFQTMGVFSIKDDLILLSKGKKAQNLVTLTNMIIHDYGNLNHRINFMQNLRSPDDYSYKHSLNVAILTALLTHRHGMKGQDQVDTILAALLHDLGSILHSNAALKTAPNDATRKKFQAEGMSLIKQDLSISQNILKILTQFYRGASSSSMIEAQILKIACDYDSLTAMSLDTEPVSGFCAIQKIMSQPEIYDKEIVNDLINSIQILPPGACVELSNHEKGLVITQNPMDILKPTILSFRDNSIYDLSIKSVYDSVQIVDIMKTMDNRFVIDEESLSKFSS